jgi:hypothetical protein
VGTYSHYRQRQIILHLKQGLLGKIRRSPLRRLLDTCNAPFYGAAGVQINPRALSGSIDDILAAIDRLAPPSVGRGW